jgi:hypothetical protein
VGHLRGGFDGCQDGVDSRLGGRGEPAGERVEVVWAALASCFPALKREGEKQKHTYDTECATENMRRNMKVMKWYETRRKRPEQKNHESTKTKNTPATSASIYEKDEHEFDMHTKYIQLFFPLLHTALTNNEYPVVYGWSLKIWTDELDKITDKIDWDTFLTTL